MATMGQKGRRKQAGGTAAGPDLAVGLGPAPAQTTASRLTLHSALGFGGRAAQFNSIVSAMPSHVLCNLGCPSRQGTADTMLLRWAT